MARWRAKNREHEKAYRKANKERDKANLKAWRAANPEKYRAQGKRAYAKLLKAHGYEEVRKRSRASNHKNWRKYLATARQRQREWRIKNLELARANARAYRAKNRQKYNSKLKTLVERIDPAYVRMVLNNATRIPGSFWPDEFVEAYGATLKLKRLWRNQKTSQNLETNS